MSLPTLCFACREYIRDMNRTIEHYSERGYEVVYVTPEDKRRGPDGRLNDSVQIIFRLNIPYYMAIHEEKLLPTPPDKPAMPASFRNVAYKF